MPHQTKDNAYWGAPLFGIEKAEKEISGYGVVVEKHFFNLKDENSFRKKTLDIILSNPDGILFAPVFERESKEFIKKCDLKGIPYVFIDSTIKGQDNLSFYGQDSYQSGYLAGKLLSFNLKKRSEVIVLNFARELVNHPHFRDREKGFNKYMKEHHPKCKIVHINISSQNEKKLHKVLSENIHNRTRGIFITSSAHKVTAQIDKIGKGKLFILGYDLTEANIKFLKDGTIDFLICQKSITQGYQGLLAIFDTLIQKREIEKTNYMPLAIITKENYKFYIDFEKLS
ncbi:MAG: substrate-binding domain-containing protein [Bacteroidales bacterium]|nr:substrate-binding domain-containing protein [Bacteroidales bacterium]